MKTLKDILAAKQEILLAAIQTARESRSQAEALSTKMDKQRLRMEREHNKYYAMFDAREALLEQAIACEKLTNA